jgi:outer membrane protein assembly factor BamB
MASDLENAMSTPIVIEVDGGSQIVSLMVEGVAGFDPATGKQLWFHPHKTQYDVNASTPVWHPASRTLLVSSAYDGGTRAIRLDRAMDRTTPKEAWFSRRLRVHHGNMIVLGDHVYASSGDFGPAPLTALDVRTGNVAWQQRAFPKVTMVQAGDRTIVLDEDGRLAITTLTPTGLQVHQEASITTKLSWTAPTLIGTRLYIRDRRSLVAIDLERSQS